MSRYNRIKGQSGVNEVIDWLKGDGFDVQAVDASGAIKRETGDIILRFNGSKYPIEVKREKKLPIDGLEKRKDDCDILVMRENHGNWKAYCDLDVLIKLLLNNRS